MHENFMALEKEKRDRIINAAMREFAVKGFKDASTNEIVKRAGISKGALFHYFSTKQGLFEFLYRYSIEFFMTVMEPCIANMPADIFERYTAFVKLKIEVAAQYPDLSDFMIKTFSDIDCSNPNFLKAEFGRFSESYIGRIHDGIDCSKFKPDVDPKKALKIIWWVLEGYALTKQKETLLLSEETFGEITQVLLREMDDYFTMLKKAFYKEEYLKQPI